MNNYNHNMWDIIYFTDCYYYGIYDVSTINVFALSDKLHLKSYFTYIVDAGYKEDLRIDSTLVLSNNFST